MKRMRYRQKRRLMRTIRLTIAGIFLLVGIGLLLLDPLKNYLIESGQKQNAIANLTREQIVANEQKEVTYDFDDVKTLNAYNVIKNNVNPKDLPTVGAVAIPSVKMNIPIYKGVSDEGMYLGAGTLSPDQKMGKSNYSLASHHSINENLLFAPLTRVKIGDYVYLTDLDKIYKYEVFFYEQVEPTRIDLIEPTSDAIVTLITCDYSLTERIVVQAKLVEEKTIDKASEDMMHAFELKTTVPES